jgi:hypothetical protein
MIDHATAQAQDAPLAAGCLHLREAAASLPEKKIRTTFNFGSR